VETAVEINGTAISSGSLLLSLADDDPDTGSVPSIATLKADIFNLELTQAGNTSAGLASLVLEGLDVGLNTGDEDINAFSINPDAFSTVIPNMPLPVNDAPVIDLDANDSSGAVGSDYMVNYAAGIGSISIVGVDAVLDDIDSPVLESITVEIINPFDGALESLAADVGTTSIVIDNTTAGTLVLNGPATIADFETVLKTVEYQNLSTTPDLTTRSITFTVNDGVDDSLPATSFVEVAPDTADPVIDINTGLLVDEGAPAVIDDISLRATDTQPSGSITYTITGGTSNGVLALSTNPPGTPVNSFTQLDIDNGSLSYVHNGSETLADDFIFEVDDGLGNVASNQVFNITVLPVNDDPILSTIEAKPAFYIENGTVGITGNLTITDRDQDDIQSATITISNNYEAGQDILTFTPQAGITGTFTNGVLSLTGPASVADYEAAIHSVSFQNLSDDPSTAIRTVEIVVNDQTIHSNTLSRDIEVIPVNDAPAIDLDDNDSSGASGADYLANYPAGIGFVSIVGTDAVLDDIDSPVLSSITVEISNPLDGALESLMADAGTSGITVDNTTAGTLVLNGPATIADFETVLKTVEYRNLSTTPDLTTRNVTFTVNDGVDDSTPATAIVKIFPDITNPIVNFNTGISLNEGSTTVIDTTSLSYIDVQPATVVSYTVVTAPANGHLAFSTAPGTPITAFTQADIDAGLLEYVHSGSETTNDDFTFTVGDSLGNVTSVQSFDFTINPVNEPPDGTDKTITLPEDTVHNFIPADFGFSDPNEGHGFQSLTFASVPANGTLKIGSAQVAIGQQIFFPDIVNLVYQPPADATGNALDTLSFRVQDDGGTNNGGVSIDPVANTITFDITTVNDAPVLSSIEAAPVFYNENGSAGITGNLSIDDIDDLNIVAATVTISNNYIATEDQLSYTPQPGISGTFSNGTLALSGSATKAAYEAVIHSVMYTNTSDNPSLAVRTVEITVNDGDVDSNTLSRDVQITPVNDAPVQSGIESTPLPYIENSGQIVISSTLALSDPDNASLQSASVQIGNYVDGEDILSFSDTGTIFHSWNSTLGILTLNGTDTVANYQAALRSVAYENISDDPDTTPRTVSFTVNDGALNSNIETRVIDIQPVNDAPVLATIEAIPAVYVENGTSTGITGNLSISDLDDAEIESATVIISNNYVPGEDTLSFNSQFGITGSFSGGTLALSGTATLVEYATVIHSVVYSNSSQDPSAATRTVSIAVNDGDVDSNLLSRDIEITPVNDAPVLSTIEVMPAIFVENGTAAGITGNLSINDADDTLLESATITISNNYVAGEDQLLYTLQPGISGTFSNGSLMLTGTASITDYEAVIHSVAFETVSENPSTATRIVAIAVNDGDADSNLLSRDVEIVPLNDAPVLAGIEALPASYTENGVVAGITGYAAGEDQLTFTPRPGISGAFSNGVLTLTGSASLTDYEAVLRSVAFETVSEDPSSDTRTVSLVINDGDIDSNTVSRNVIVNPVNDAPVLATIEALPAIHTENGTATGITGNLSVGDVDDALIESATVTISNNYTAGEDLLSFVAQPGIAGSFANGVLTLTGSATLAEYESVIHSVKYSNSSENPSAATRTVEIRVNDGDVDSNVLSREVEVIPVNDAPVASGIESTGLFYLENSGPVAISATLGLSDIDNTDLTGATVQLANHINGEDVLSFTDTATITHTWNSAAGILTLSGTDTVANYQAALRSVAYENISDNPLLTPRTAEFTVFDGDVDSNIESRIIDIGAVNNAPVLSTIEVMPAIHVENAAATGITGNLSVADVDDTQIESATVTISSNYVAAEDQLTFTPQSGISGSFANGILTLTGTAALADYEAVIHSIAYETTSENPSAATRTVEITVNDGDTDSNPVSRDVEVIPVNDAPVVSGVETASLQYQENSGAAAVSSTLVLSDIDDASLNGATVQVGGYVNGEDVLSFTDTATITHVWNPSNGTLTLSGVDTVANYQAALRSISYENTANNPTTGGRTVDYTVFDGDVNSNVDSRVIDIGAVNDAPVLSTIEVMPAIHVENAAATGITGNLSVADVDDTQIESATVTISNNYVSAEDQLVFTPQSGISGSFTNGVLTLTGTAPLADYEAVIHSVAYETTSENPSTATRTVEITVNDGDIDSNPVSRDVEVIPVNDAPLLSTIEMMPAIHTENGTATGITGNLSISDVDDTQIESADITISNNYIAGEDQLTFMPQAGISGVFSNGTLSLTGSATVADYEAVIHSVAYFNTSENPSAATRTVAITVNDGDVNSNTLSRDVEVIPVNDAPVVSG